LTVLLMVLVNLQGSHEAAFALLKHAPWHGMTFADLVFPWFILIVGMSLAFTADSAAPKDYRTLFRRTLILLCVGIALGWLIRPSLDPSQVRWTGVLQRIAIVYCACALVAFRMKGVWPAAALAGLCLAAHSAILVLVTAPGETAPSLAMGAGISGWLDRELVPGRLYGRTYDPEGALSTLSAIGTGLVGLAAMRWRRAGAGRGALLILGATLTAGGAAASVFLPLNKPLWTASYALVAAGTGILVLMLLRGVAERYADSAPVRLLAFAGRTALTLYVVHMLLIALLVRHAPDGRTWWAAIHDTLGGAGLSPAMTSLLFALIASALSLAPLAWLKRRGLLLRA